MGLPLSSERASAEACSNPRSRVPQPPQPAVRTERRNLCRVSPSLRLLNAPCPSQVNFGSTMRAIAQMKPTSSRATATIAVGADLPRAIRAR